jgi:hypothetical protein
MDGRTRFLESGAGKRRKSVRHPYANLAKDRKKLGWVAASGVVGADIGVLDNPVLAYYVPSWHRQCPARFAIHDGKVETTIYFGSS